MEGRCAELLPKETSSSKIGAAAAEGGSGLWGCHSSVDFLKDKQELNLSI